MGLNLNQLNVSQLNDGVQPAQGAATPPDYSDSYGRPYRLEMREQDGTLITYLPQWWEGEWVQKFNVPDTLRFTYDADDEMIQDADFPKEIWLYRGDNTTPVQKFTILSITEIEGTEHTITLECESLISQLTREIITLKRVFGSTIATFLGDILTNDQLQTPMITLGSLAPTVAAKTIDDTFENVSFLQILNNLLDQVGGMFSVDINRKLNWTFSPGFDLGYQIRLNKNASSITRVRDYRTLNTRVHALGFGTNPESRISVTVDDAPAQAEYGIITGILNNQSIRDAARLTDIADAELARRKVPETQFQTSTIDLSHKGTSYNFEAGAIELGSIVNLIAPLTGIDIQCKVAQITRTLDDPLSVQLNFTDPASGLMGNDSQFAGGDGFFGGMVDYRTEIDRLENDIGAGKIREVNALPDIPEEGYEIVYFSGGTPPQLWIAYSGQDEWTPLQFLTTDDGTP